MKALRYFMLQTMILLMQGDPRRGLSAVVIAIAFIVTLSLSSNALTEVFARWIGYGWLVASPILLVVIILGFVWAGKQSRSPEPQLRSILGEKPAPHAGIIWLLSTPSRSYDVVKEEVEWLLDSKLPDYGERLRALVNATNIEPAIQAIRFHSDDGTLRRVWVLSTHGGSDAFVKRFVEIASAACGISKSSFQTPEDDPALLLSGDELTATYRAVKHIYENTTSEDLPPNDIIADITGGRATMSIGMALYCIPSGYPIQYTSTVTDPGRGPKGERAEPRVVRMEATEVLRLSAESILRRTAEPTQPSDPGRRG